jgi:hypothetical protein
MTTTAEIINQVDATVGKAINEQTLATLGGANKVCLMLGSKFPVCFDNANHSVRVSIGAKNRIGATIMIVTLEEDDTYTVTFWKVRGIKTIEISNTSMIFNDQLVGFIERTLGLYINL